MSPEWSGSMQIYIDSHSVDTHRDTLAFQIGGAQLEKRPVPRAGLGLAT